MTWMERFMLGKSLVQQKVVSVELPAYAKILILGRPGVGKTLLAKNIVTQLNQRKIVIFDYSGEWALSKYPNLYSTDMNYATYLPFMKVVRDMKFPISEYTSILDWNSMKMRETGAQLTSMVASWKHAHHDEWVTFRQILRDLPLGNYVKKFNEVYDVKLSSGVNLASFQSIQKNIDFVAPIFEEQGTEYSVRKLLNTYRHLDIMLNLNNGNFISQRLKAQLIVGKFLQKMTDHLHKHNPVIVFEEAGVLCPPTYNDQDEMFLSLNWIIEYVQRLSRRNNTMMVFIAQNEEQLHPAILRNIDYKIVYDGTIDGRRSVFKGGSKDAFDGKSDYFQIFQPLDCSSRYENYPEIQE